MSFPKFLTALFAAALPCICLWADEALSFAPRKADVQELTRAGKGGVKIGRAELPAAWNLRIQGNPEQSAGALNVDTLSGIPVVLLEFPCNKFNGVQLISRKHFADANGKQLSFRARGNGTLHLFIQAKNGNVPVAVGTYLVNTAKWHTFRSDKIKVTGDCRISCSVYGKIELADGRLEELPAIDPKAELVFYAPFETGSANALFSIGNTAPFGAVDFEAVPGVCGQAVRISRARRLQKNGFLRYPIGFGYEFLKNVVSPDSGTIEFYFHPLPEMLEKQQWASFPLFYFGDSTWQWPDSCDFDLGLEYRNGKLILTLNEHARAHIFPNGTPQKPPKQSDSFTIKDAERFISQWHHLAFCYDETKRQVFLDGKPVITTKALKQPALSSRIPQLLFANGHYAHPAVMSSDLDELKIYRHVKYHRAFTPSASPERFQPVASDTQTVPSKNNWRPGKAEVLNGGKTAAIPLNGDYELLFSFANGYPSVLNPQGNLTRIKVETAPDLPELVMEDLQVKDREITGKFKKYGTSFRWRLDEKTGVISATLDLERADVFWPAFLELSVALRRKAGPFAFAYDGWMTRPVCTPFVPFSFDGVMMALPVSAAWTGRDGAMIALTPETLCGELRRGMSNQDTIYLKIRTAMKDAGKGRFAFEIAPFDSRYAEAEALDAWHARHRNYFGYNPALDERCYGNIMQGLPWNTADFRKRGKNFSYMEIARRLRAGWVWFYESGPSVGNWSADRELLEELPPLNIPYGGDAQQNSTWNDQCKKKMDQFSDAGIAAAPYVSSWSEHRNAGLFADSVIEPNDSYNGIVVWPDYWKRGVVDQVMMPKFTKYGTFLRRHLDTLLQRYPEVSFFSYDLAGYDYRFHKVNSAGWLNGFDERGACLPHVTALGALMEEMRQVKSAGGHPVSFNGNTDVSRASFNTSFRLTNTVHEQNYVETTQNWHKLRQQTRLHGERPTVFLPMPPLDGNYFGDEDPRLLRYSAIWLHHSHILLGALFNIRQNDEIFGVRESVDALDPLLRLQSLGLRQSPRAQITGGLSLARYGEAENGAWAVVNFHPESRTGILTLDQESFGRTVLPAIDGKSIEITPVNQVKCELPPLSFLAVETLGSVPAGQEIACTSTLKREPHQLTWTLTFHRDTDLTQWRFNRAFDGDVPKHVKKGKSLVLISRDKRWLCTPQELQQTVQNWNGNVAITAPDSPEGDRAKRRIAEFFRFGTMINGKESTPVSGQVGNIVVQTGNADSLAVVQGKVVLIVQPEHFRQMTDLMLKNLEILYPYYSVFGKQQPVKPLDWAPTRMQKKFQERGKAIGKLQSTEEAAAEFRQYLKDKNLDPYRKF